MSSPTLERHELIIYRLNFTQKATSNTRSQIWFIPNEMHHISFLEYSVEFCKIVLHGKKKMFLK